MPVDVRVTTADISLHCTPAVNLFSHSAEPISLEGRAIDQRLVPMGRTVPMRSRFSRIDEVEAAGIGSPTGSRGVATRTFHSFESLQHESEHSQGRASLYYRTRA
ncbi:type VI secretion system baseplate subunit TssF [Pseudomonas aeruginosa]|nr:type VI secretion system baseplate subunit TssF [Pseudomonas aeruginosa]